MFFFRCACSLGVTALAVILTSCVLQKCTAQNYSELNDSLESLYAKGLYQDALIIGERALSIAESEYGRSHRSYAESLGNIGVLYSMLGELVKAREFHLKALNYSVPNTGPYALRLNNLALVEEKLGNIDEATELFKQARSLTDSTMGRENSQYSMILSNMGLLFSSISAFEEALPLQLEAMELEKKAKGESHADYGTHLNNVANLYRDIGDYENANHYYTEAIDNCLESVGKDHVNYGVRISNYASFLRAIGQNEKALSLGEEALINCEKWLGRNHPQYGIRLNNLAITCQNSGQFDDAENYFQLAIQNAKNYYGENHQVYAVRLNNLSGFLSDLGRDLESLPLSESVLSILLNQLDSNHIKVGIAMNNLGEILLALNEYERADKLFKEAMEIAINSVGNRHVAYRKFLSNSIQLHRIMRSEIELSKMISEANSMLNRAVESTFQFSGEKRNEAFLRSVQNEFFLYESIGYSIDTIKCLAGINLSNRLMLKELLLNRSLNVLSGLSNLNEDTIQKKILEYRRLRWALQQKQIDRSSKKSELDSIQELIDESESDLVLTYSERFNYRSLKVGWQEVRSELGEDDLAIEFSHFGYHGKQGKTDSTLYVGYVFARDWEHPKVVYLFEENELEEVLLRNQESMESYEDHVNRIYRDELYDLVWEPLDSLLDGVKTVYYSPSGLLNEVSFSAMRSDDGTYLGDRYEMNHLSSTAQLLEDEEEPKATDLMPVVYGGMYYDLDTTALRAEALAYEGRGSEGYELVFDSTRGATWKYLEGTKKEAELISGLFAKNAVSTRNYTGSKATEESFKYGIPRDTANFLHIGTHGFFYPNVKRERKEFQMGSDVFRYAEDPMFRSGLIMAGGNRVWRGGERLDGIDDGVLTSYEVSNTDLRNTELVVLSACETGRGDINGSEGVYGLQRAFKMAGVDKLIMSLWKVPDAQTAELMGIFYEVWLSGKTVSESFRKAQNEMNGKYEPYYWGAFTLVR